MSFPSSVRDRPASRAMRSAMTRSRSVQVGDWKRMVSERIPAAMSPASFWPGMMPRSWNMVAMMVVLAPTASVRT